MESIIATREVLWLIPTSFKIAMYASMLIAFAVMGLGIFKKYQFVSKGNKVKGLFSNGFNACSFIDTVFFTGKVGRDKEVGLFHSLIFYGFVILTIATELVAIHADSPFKIYQGNLYIIISFLADFAGLAILIGLILAYKRRYIKRPKYLESTKPKSELFMYVMILSLVAIGFILEGLRITGSGMPVNEALWSPLGWMIAKLFSAMNLSEGALATTYKGLWFFHMMNTMLFIASIGNTKFFHIIALPFNALITQKRQGGILQTMNFEDETAETFGLGKASELTAKQRMELLSCVECGRCTQVCPAYIAGRPLDPKKIITKIRDTVLAAGNEDVDFWGKEIFSSTEIDSCTTCGACMEECPANIEHIQTIMGLKRYKTLTLGNIPADAATAANNIRVNGNPWGVSQDDRFNWADGLDVPVIKPGEKVDYLYFVGCAGAYDAGTQKIVKDTMELLKKADVSFAVMGKEEKCCGDPTRRFGDEYSFVESVNERIDHLNQFDFGKVLSHCPHCLHTIGKEYEKFDNGNFETVHHTELLAELLEKGKLKPVKEVKEEVSYHDPCYLGRHHGQYDAPRNILEAIPGLSIKEMEKSRDKSQCCGMGGGNMWYEVHDGTDPVEGRLEHVAETKVEKLATSCSFCMINFNSGKGKIKQTEELLVEDIASILKKSIE